VYVYVCGFPSSSHNANNYLVDMVHYHASVNTPPPPAQTSTPGATGISSLTAISAMFNETIQLSTIAFGLTGTNSQVMDPLDNRRFSGGSQSGTMVTNASPGDSLASIFSENFTETSVSSSWTTNFWTPAGGGPTGVATSRGVLSVAGAELLSTTTVPAGVAVEGSVNFAAGPYEHFDMATYLSAVSAKLLVHFHHGRNVQHAYRLCQLDGQPAARHDDDDPDQLLDRRRELVGVVYCNQRRAYRQSERALPALRGRVHHDRPGGDGGADGHHVYL
jgi:hypothetical protein